MRILLIHPEDDPEKGPWSNLHWDRIVDLGLGGQAGYARWGKKFACDVTSINCLRHGSSDFHRVRDLLRIGCGRLVDDYGLDWWELTSIYVIEELEALILLQRLADTLRPGDEVHISRPGLHADLLRSLVPDRVSIFPRMKLLRLGHYFRTLKKLSLPQMIDGFWGKYDPGYQLRGRFTLRPRPASLPVVLLPTAYVNVSRTGVAYAKTVPRENFLLVATRRNGWMSEPPPNVQSTWLSGYASVRDRTDENASLEARWQSLLNELIAVPEFEILSRIGRLSQFSWRFRRGLEIRDAWRNVLDNEPVQAVLCADDNNPNISIPLLLARQRGLPNIACHHGALDGQYVYKLSYASLVLARGRMEEDYLVRCCGVPARRIAIAAPRLPAGMSEGPNSNRNSADLHILFISEVFEVNGGRGQEFYRDVLPALADLALQTGRKLIVKLHPSESKHERRTMLSRVLSSSQRCVAKIVDGPLTAELISGAWFGITVLSTVAVECALRGIPCFLCRWLESWQHGYIEQFIRFGVAIGLNDPSEIGRIPDYLQHFRPRDGVVADCWEPITEECLTQMLTSSHKSCVAAAS